MTASKPTRRQQKRERVRLGLALRRVRRRWIHDARWARHDRAVHFYYARLADHCRCCRDCCFGPCDAVMQGGVCEMTCICASLDAERRELDEQEFDDWRDDDDYGLDSDGWRP